MRRLKRREGRRWKGSENKGKKTGDLGSADLVPKPDTLVDDDDHDKVKASNEVYNDGELKRECDRRIRAKII